MAGWWTRLLDVRTGELRRAASMFSLLGLIIATSYVLKPVRSSLFLSQFGAARLPYVYVVVAIVLGVVAAAFARWAPRIHLPRLFSGVVYFFAANLVFFWIAAVADWPWTGFAFYVWVSIFTALVPSLFWLLANYIFYANEGRRLFPIVMAGGLLGSIVGGAATSILVGYIGTPGLLLIAAVLLIAIAGLVHHNAIHERERMSERRAEIARQEKIRSRRGNESPLRLITGSRYLTMLAALIFLTTMTSILVDYQFNTVVERSFATEDALTGFFGSFFAAINVMAFVLQLVVVPPLLSRGGVAAGLVVLPLALFGSSFSFLLMPRLLTAALIKAADDGLSNSVNKASVEVLYLPIGLAVKNRLKAWLDMFVERVSRGVSGLAILLMTGALSLSVHQMSLVVVALLVPWIVLVVILQREYVKTFRDSLARRDLTDLAAHLQDQASLSVFHHVLSSADPRELVYVLALAQGVDDAEIVERVVLLTSHPDGEVRKAAYQFLRGAKPPPDLDDFARRIADVAPGAAAEALALWVQTEPEEGYQALGTILRDGDAARIDAILESIELSHDYLPEHDVETFVAERWEAGDASTRRLAARAAGFLSKDAPAVTCLLELVEEEDVDVARAAATSIGRLRYEAGWPLLTRSLRRRPLRAAARKAMAAFGAERIDELAARYRDERENLDVRMALPLVIAEFDDARAVASLFASLPQSDRRLQYQGIKGLGKLRSRFPGLRFSKSEVDRLLKGEASQLAALASLRSGVASVTPELDIHVLLLRVLDERLEFTRERIFRLLGLVYPADAIYSASDRIVHGRPAVRASALEYLSNILSKKHRASIFPLIEAEAWSEVHERSRKLLGSSTLGFREALTRLVRHRDPWLAASAVTLVGRLEGSSLREELERIRDHPSVLVREAVLDVLD